jgi:adhesin/invasin
MSNPPEVLVGAGDIARCNFPQDEETATLLDGIAGTVFTAGDNAYENGTLTEYNNCYGPSWGRHKARTRPVPGNHEYNTANASGYFNYFGAAAGVAGKGYYSYDLGDWHIIALNNYISMAAGSEQNTWLAADLAATTKPCRLAYYHEPLYSSANGTGSGGTSTNAVLPLFTTLYNGGVDVVVNGHRHFYERLAPMNPQGQVDVEQGIRHFIVGTGGSSITNPTNVFPLSEVRFGDNNHGVLKLYLYSDSYAWKFVPVPGRTLSDTGSTACHSQGSGVSASQSTVTAVPTAIPVGESATIVVTVKDGTGQPISGATVQLAVTPEDGATLTQPASPTGVDGVATGTLSSAVVGNRTVSATATVGSETTPLNQTATVVVAPPTVITSTLLTVGNNTANQKVYTTAPIFPAANTLVTVAVLSHRSSGAVASPTLSGGGMTTWTEVGSITFDTGTEPLRRLTLFRAMSAAPGSGPLTISFNSTVSHSQWIVSQWAGVDLSGVNGAGAIVQVGSIRDDAVTGLTVPLAAFGNTNNVAYGAFGVNRNVAVITPGAGFTEIAEQPSGENTPGDLQAEWRINDNTIDATWPLTLNGGALGVEIKAAASGSGSGVDALQSTVSAAPTSITAGSGTATITVTARSADGTPVSGAIVELAATGSGNTLTQPGPTDGNGVATGTLSSTVAEAKTVSAIADGTAISQQAAVSVTAGPVSASQSTVTASPSSIQPGGQMATVTVTVKDAHGNPISGATVQLSATGSGNTLSAPGPTDASGIYTGTLSSTVAEDKVVTATATVAGVATALNQSVTVTVTSQATAISTTLLTVGTDVVNQRIYTTAPISPAANTLVMVAVLGHSALGTPPIPTLSGGGMAAWDVVATVTFDGASSLRRLTVFRAMSAAPGSGPLTITSSLTLAHSQWIVSQWSGVETSGVNGSGAIVQTGSTRDDAVTGLTVPLAAFGHANNVAYGAFGVNRNVAVITPGAGFTEIAEQPSGESTPGDLQAEWRTNDNTIDATWPLNLNGGALGVEIKAAASGSGSGVDPSQSTLEASPTTLTPGGAGSTITVTVRDAGGSPLSGVVVELAATGTGNTLSPSGPTDLTGVYEGTLSSTKAEAKLVTATATLGSVTTALNATAVVTVEPGPVSATQSSLSAAPTSIPVGSGVAAITVTVKDAHDNPISGATVQLSATGSGNTLSAPGTTDANGVYTGTLSSTVVGDKVVSASATVEAVTTPIAATATVEVESGASATLSTVAAAPGTIEAGTGSAAITVTVRDASGDPISGAEVELAATGAGNTLSAPGPTDVNGVYTGTLSSTVVGEKTVSATADETGITQTALVTVTAGAVHAGQSTVVAAPSSIEAGTGTATITVTARDAFGNPVDGAAVELAVTGSGNTLSAPGLTDANGVYTGTLSSTVGGEKTVSATAGGTGITQTALVTVTAGAVDAGQSTVVATPTSIAQGGAVATITVTARDVLGNAVEGAAVQLAATGSGNTLSAPGLTDENGVYTGTLSSTVAGEKVVSATADGTSITQTAAVTVSQVFSAALSTVAAAPGTIEAGTGSATITVTVRDANGDPMSGAAVELAATGAGNTLSAPGLTDENGIYTGTLSSTVAEEKVVSASVGGVSIAQTASVTVLASGTVSAAHSTVVAVPSSIEAGTGIATITVTARDVTGNPVPDVTVELAATGSGNTLSAPGLTDENGVYTGTLSSTGAGEKSVSATADGTGITQSAVVTVTAGAVDAGQSTVVATPTSMAQGGAVATITVTAKDAFGNPVGGAAVELAATGAGNTLSAPGLTDENGVYTGTLSSTVAGEKVVSATADGTSITQTAAVTVSQVFSAALSTVAAAPGTIEAGTGSAAITVTVRDANGDPMSGAAVELAATGAGNTLSAPGLTDENGVYTGTLSSTSAGEKIVAATADGTGITQSAVVTVTAGAVNAGQSTVVAAPTSILQGGEMATITVTAKDAFGNPVGGAAVELAATGSGNTLSAPGLTDENGVYTGTLSSTVAEEKTVSATATIQGVTTAITQTTAVLVTPSIATITQTLLAVGTNTVNQKIYPTGAVAPAANTLITVAVLGHSSLGTPPIPTLSGGGMTAWDVVATVTFDGATPLRRLTVFRATSAAPGSGPLTITSSMTLSHVQWIVSQWDGAETSGVNGAGGIVQTGTAQGTAVNSLTVPLAAFGHANNVAYGAFGVTKNAVAVTPGAGFTEISEQPSGEGTLGDLQAQWATNLNTILASWTNLNAGALGIEIKARTN